MSEPPSNREWIFWGRHDPLFAVATLPGRERSGASPWTREDFLADGQRYMAPVINQWRAYGMSSHRCAEIGCGAGRITHVLASLFSAVVAVDVSEDQIDHARQMTAEASGKITFAVVTEPRLPWPNASCDAVFSCEVFQHLDPGEAMVRAYIGESFRVLEPGGTVCLQIPIEGLQPKTLLSSFVRNRLLKVLRRVGRRRLMIYRTYTAAFVTRTMRDASFADIELRTFAAPADSIGMNTYVFGRKPGSASSRNPNAPG